MARNSSYRWQGWVANNSKRNPDGRQRQCSTCGQPFVPPSDWTAKCRRCRTITAQSKPKPTKAAKSVTVVKTVGAAPGTGTSRSARKRRQRAALAAEAAASKAGKTRTPIAANGPVKSQAEVVGSATAKTKSTAGASTVTTTPTRKAKKTKLHVSSETLGAMPPGLSQKRLSAIRWPFGGTDLPVRYSFEGGVLSLAWTPSAGEATIQTFDATGHRVACHRVAARVDRSHQSKLAAAAGPFTVLLVISNGPRDVRACGRTQVATR